MLAPFFLDLAHFFLKLVAERELLFVELLLEDFSSLLGDCGKQFVGGVGE